MNKRVLLQFEFNGEARWGECVDYENGKYLCSVINYTDDKNWQVWVEEGDVLDEIDIIEPGNG